MSCCNHGHGNDHHHHADPDPVEPEELNEFQQFMSYLHPRMQSVAQNFNMGPDTKCNTLQTLYEIIADINSFVNGNPPLTVYQRKTLEFQKIYCDLAKFSYILSHTIEKLGELDFDELKMSLVNYQETELHYFQKLIIFFEIFKNHQCFHLAKTFLDLMLDFLKTIDKRNLMRDAGFSERDIKDLIERLEYIPLKIELDLTKEFFSFQAHIHGKQPIQTLNQSLVDSDLEKSLILREMIVHKEDVANESYDISKRILTFEEAENFSDIVLQKHKICEENYPEFKRCSRRIIKLLNKMGILFDADTTDYLPMKESLKGLLYQKTAIFCEDLDNRQKLLKKSIDTIKSSEDGYFVEADYKEYQNLILMAEADRSHELYWKTRYLIAVKNNEFENKVTMKPLQKVARKRINHGEKFIEMVLEDDVKSQMEDKLFYSALDLVKCSAYLLKDKVLAARFANQLALYMKQHPRVAKEFPKVSKVEIIVDETPERELANLIMSIVDNATITI